MHNSLNVQAAQPISALGHTSAEDTIAGRAFDSMRNDIGIAGQAAQAALGSLRGLMQRLGVASMYGCGGESTKSIPSSGEIEDTQREMYALIDLVREIRGLAETIDARL